MAHGSNSGNLLASSSKTTSLSTVLKALMKSSCSSILSGFFSSASFTPCEMASHPPGTETPSWRGERKAAARSATAEAAHLATIRRRMFPTAMGRTPPSFFRPAWSLAPQRNGATLAGTSPFSIALTRRVRLASALSLLAGASLRASLTCSGLRPDRPPADPFRKRWTALKTAGWETVRGGVSEVGRGMGPGGAGGCLDLRGWLRCEHYGGPCQQVSFTASSQRARNSPALHLLSHSLTSLARRSCLPPACPTAWQSPGRTRRGQA